MENLQTTARPQATASKESLDHPLGEAANLPALFWRDPAAYLIYLLIFLRVTDRRSDLESILGASPEIKDTMESILAAMVECGIVELQGDRIKALVSGNIYKQDPESLRRFLPQIFRTAVNRVLVNEIERPMTRSARKEMVYYAQLPDAPEVASELHKINQEYKAKITALSERVKDKDLDVRGVRFVGTVTSVLEPEDFL